MGLSVWQILLVVLIFLLLFGRGKIPALMGDLAAGIKSFKKGISDEEQAQPAAKLEQQTVGDKAEQTVNSQQPSA
ncbi:twin-arginine translocase TatA/TatE family subunit [Bowmanella sp. Y26]|uniref:twin-arginine translocase TatA/TatE family subunit n=1 Tax=Bowmanella yangjiangensis TaxID=2811230 RepID=UPI001BDC7B51|nr:twin-arginine translocase TatA/TatE family subunit [Bowmanella yangjiangensis]MBT1064198.1 twin-arginine translocase TatA/TatE family subunit [Bowmanella yangjiangensis]